MHIRDVSKAEKKNKIHLNEFESEKGEESVEHMLWSEQPKSESIRTHTHTHTVHFTALRMYFYWGESKSDVRARTLA